MKLLVLFCLFTLTARGQDFFRMGFILNSDVQRERMEQARLNAAAVESNRIANLWTRDTMRIVRGKLVSANGPQWRRIYGKVARLENGLLLINGGCGDYRGTFAVTNFPVRMYVGQVLERTNAWNALPSEPLSLDGQSAPIPCVDYWKVYVPGMAGMVSLPAATPADEARARSASQARAFRTMLAMAEGGDGFSAKRVGEMYRDGEGVGKDLAKARLWLSKAASLGAQDAAQELASLPAN